MQPSDSQADSPDSLKLSMLPQEIFFPRFPAFADALGQLQTVETLTALLAQSDFAAMPALNPLTPL